MRQKVSLIFNGLAVIVWAALAVIRLLQAWQSLQIVPELLAIESLLVAYRLAFRRLSTAQVLLYKTVAAWLSALLPLALHVDRANWVGQIMTVAGLGIVIYALCSLGKSFGIAPADRGLVQAGPYRWVRHPMYLGELLSLGGAVLLAPTAWNIGVLLILLITILLRIHWEEALLQGYVPYSHHVRWRLIPYLF